MATPITTTDWIAERVLIVDEDPSAFPAVLLFQEDGSHRLRCSCCPAEDLFVIGESGGRACFHDNRHHRFLIWNIADEVLEATIDEPPRFHSGREVASGFSFIPNSRRYYIVFVRIPILQLRRNNNDGVSFDRDLDFFTSDGDGGQWVSCSIRCPWPYHPYAEPAVEANGFLYWRGSVFSRKIIIRLDCLQLRFDEVPLPSSLDFKTARLGFGPDGALALASYNSSPGLLRLWVYSGGRWIQDTRVPFTSKDKSILSMDRGTHWFLPLVFFRGVANEQHRIFLKDNKDVWRFTSTQDGTFRFSLVCETVQCRALPFRPTPVEEPLLKDKEEAEKLDCAVEFADEAEKLEVDYFDQLAKQLESASPLQIIDKALQMFGNDIAIFFSGAEDVALIEYAHLTGRPYRVFSLDTGRLNPETYQFFDTVEKHYGIHIEYMCTDSVEVQALVRSKGLFYFFEDGHQDCCRVRKVRPLRRALKGLRAWITGQRKDQSPGTGSEVPVVQVDPVFEGLDGGAGSLVKWNPLANVAGNDVRNFLHAMNVPVNSLHSQGYISIGCEPCTGSVLPRQHEREGWWLWEDAKAKECGLHKGNLKHEEGQANGNGAANPNGSATADIFTSTEDIKEGRGKSSRERDKVQSSRDRDKLRSSRGRDKLKRN